MNKILSTLAIVAGVPALIGCDEYDDRYNVECASVVRFDTYGEQHFKVWSTDAETRFAFKVMRGGHNTTTAETATAHVMTDDEWANYSKLYDKGHYHILPADCYRFDGTGGSSASLDFNALINHGSMSLTFDNAKVGEFVAALPTQDEKIVCVPLTLEASAGSVLEEQRNLLLMPEYEQPGVSISPAGFDRIRCLGSAAPYVREYTVSLSRENPWGFTLKLTNSQEALDRYNAGNGTLYTLMQPGALEMDDNGSWKPWSDRTLEFPAGVSSVSFSVRINPAQVGMMDAIALTLKDPSINLAVDPSDACNIFALVVKPSRSKIKVADVTSSTNDGIHPVKNLVDGKTNTYYSSQTAVHDGDPVYGSYVDMTLTSPVRYLSFDYMSRFDVFGDGSGVPNEVDIYVSDEGTTWVKCGTIKGMRADFTGARQTETYGNFDAGKPVTHVRWAVIKGGAQGDLDHRAKNTTAYWSATALNVYGR